MHTILQKIEILQKLEKGVLVHNLCDSFGIDTSMIYDVKK